MKTKLFFYLACLCLCISSCYDDTYIREKMDKYEDRLDELEEICSKLNDNISDLQTLIAAIEKGGYVTDVTALTEGTVFLGYKITLSNGNTMTLYHGEKGQTPNIGVKQDTDGKYYWTVGGDWILDDTNKKIQVAPEDAKDGITPMIEIHNDKWCVSYDNGATWKELGTSMSENPCLFTEVQYENDNLMLYFSDGGKLVVPIGSKFQIFLGNCNITDGNRYEIPYTIKGAKSEVSIFAVLEPTQSYNDVRVIEVVEDSLYCGRIIVDSYWSDQEITRKLAIFAIDENGTTISKIFRVTTGVLQPIDDKYEYIINADTEQFEIMIATNREFEVATSEDWLSYVSTKTVEEKTLVFNVQKNTGIARDAKIYVRSGDRELYLYVYQKPNIENLFEVNLTYQLYTTNSTMTVYLSETESSAIRNAKGQTLAESLGYKSWDKLAYAAGTAEDLYNFTGDVKITAYDPTSGDSFGYMQYYYTYNPIYYFDERGKVSYDYNYSTLGFEMPYSDMLQSQFYVYANNNNLNAGHTYSYGIMFTTPKGVAYINVNVYIEKYDDPEEGKYTDPQFPGRYEFEMETIIEVPDTLTSETRYVYNYDLWEKVKETTGMTSMELYYAKLSRRNYYILSDDSTVELSSLRLDIDGKYNTSSSYVVNVSPQTFYSKPETNRLRFLLPTTKDSEGNLLPAAQLQEAIEQGRIFHFTYVLECEIKTIFGELSHYEFYFHYTVQFKKKY